MLTPSRWCSAALSPRGAWPLRALARGAPTPVAHERDTPSPIACTRGALPSKSPHVHRRILLWWPAPPPLALSHNSTLTLLWAQTSSQVPLAVVFCSPAHGTPLPSPLGCLHTTNPSLLPKNDLWSLSLSTQTPPEHLKLWCPGAVLSVACVVHCLLCLPQSSC